jgi:hypothetical protein
MSVHVIALLLLVMLVMLVASYGYRRKAARRAAERWSREKELLSRLGDLTDEILARHIPTLLEKATPHIAYDDYDTLVIGPEFDREIRYFVQRIILEDPAHVKAVQAIVNVDPAARTLLLSEQPAALERAVRNSILVSWRNQL